ncbi:hypothetical protein [Coralliovum pocilloporae]|uniref:hypothetical protein n=1 Tax=Coralliovum pocilloporae TaxID=3066369 RepID=UPI00330750EE
MIGDTGVILPEHLSHPTDWPVWEDIPHQVAEEIGEEDELDAETTSDNNRVEKPADEALADLAASSSVSADLKDGRLHVTHAPLKGQPRLDNPDALNEAFGDLAYSCRMLLDRWEERPPNVSDRSKAEILAFRALSEAREREWYKWQVHSEMLSTWLREEADNHWQGMDSLAKSLLEKVQALKPYLKRESASETDKDKPVAPDIRLSEEDMDKIEDGRTRLSKVLDDETARNGLTDDASEFLEESQKALEQGAERIGNPDRTISQIGHELLQKAIHNLAGFTSSAWGFLRDAGKDAIKTTVKTALKTRLQDLLNWLLSFF